jgi:L-lactate dehydrogenase complex protein LldG
VTAVTADPRNTILSQLKSAAPREIPQRPQLPPLSELSLDAPQLIEKFSVQFTAQGGIAHRVDDQAALLDKLAFLLSQAHVTRAMATSDDVIGPLRLREWGERTGIAIVSPADFADREGYTRSVFDDVQAGITGVDFAVAESGTLVLAHGARMARLVSLAPILHIAVIPVSHIVPIYEKALASIYTRERRPSQVTLITGPSMTADIQGKMFRGMHGPQKLVALILG